MTIKASDLFVQALENEGVTHVFGVPGEENLDFLDSLSRSSIHFILTRHEQAAGFMAATFGRLTGKPGVCLSTLGPGATNLVTAAAYAQLGAMPLMMITGQKPIKDGKQGRFQIIDTIDMMRPLTKFTRQIISPGSIPALVREAFRVARQERPGAVHLELPEDIAAETTDNGQLFEVRPTQTPECGTEALQAAVEMIAQAKAPLLLIGAGANRRNAIESLRKFVDATGIAVFSTQMGKGVISEDHPNFIGTTALSAGDYVHCAIDHADLIINAGHDVVEKPPFLMAHGGARVIHANFSPAEVDRVYFPQLELVGDIGKVFDWLRKNMAPISCPGSAYFKRVHDHVASHIDEKADDPRFPPIPQRVVADMRKIMPRDGIIALDNGMYKIWFARNYPAYWPNTVLLDNALATMGAGLPGAMMASILNPEKPVLAVCGDGGFMMNAQEMETAVRLKLDLVVLVLRDDSYGMIRWKQAVGGLPDWGLTFGNPDFVRYAESYGASGHRVEATQDFAPLLAECFAKGGVHLIDLPIDYSENKRVLIDELAARVCRI